MKIHSTKYLMPGESSEERPNWLKGLAKLSALVCVVVVPLSGCTTTTRSFQEDWTPYASIKLIEGDALSITFPGSPDLNTTQRIRRDGKMDLKTVGEFPAAGKRPRGLERAILRLLQK